MVKARQLCLAGFFLLGSTACAGRQKAEDVVRGKLQKLDPELATKREPLAPEPLIMVLTARGIVIDEVTRTRLLGERDADRLDRWIVRATTCQTLAELDVEP